MTAVTARIRGVVRGGRHLLCGVAPNVRGFVWAFRAVRTARRKLNSEGTLARLPYATRSSGRGTRGVDLAVAIARPTCLERALMVQAWAGGVGPAPDVVLGVRNDNGTVEAHAWVDGEGAPWFDPRYRELTRLAP